LAHEPLKRTLTNYLEAEQNSGAGYHLQGLVPDTHLQTCDDYYRKTAALSQSWQPLKSRIYCHRMYNAILLDDSGLEPLMANAYQK